MKSKRFSLFVCVVLWTLCLAQASDAGQSAATQLVEQYLAAREVTMKPGATEKDVDKALSYLADDAVYEHPRANARIVGKTAMRSGMVGFLGAAESVEIKTLSRMSNSAAVVVEQQIDMIVNEDGKSTHTGHQQITVFEIKDGKISRMIDYWEPGKQN